MTFLDLPYFMDFVTRVNGDTFEISKKFGFEQILIFNSDKKLIEKITVPKKIRGKVSIHDLKRSSIFLPENEYLKNYPIKEGDIMYRVYLHPDGGKSLSEFTIEVIV
jgi:hypothetical protein